MKDLSEFSEKSTSKYELLCHLNDTILAGDITTFSALYDYLKPIPASYKVETILPSVFEMIKQLNWGFFEDLSIAKFTKLWRELVIPHEKFRDYGDLKRNISISNIYLAMLDIHGYTRFCQDSRGNLSQLHMLDDFITNGIPRLTQVNGVLTKRERGDEIILIGTTATDIIRSTLMIFNSFSSKPLIKDPSVPHDRTAYSVVLPDFKISAGIAGGNITTPLVVTEHGMLSGFLLNTAARLQSRANELDPSESKLVIANTVYLNFIKENSIVTSPMYAKKAIYFYDNGTVDFKGVSLSFYEVIFKEDERYKEKLADQLTTLFETIKGNQWQKNVIIEMMKTLAKSATTMAPFETPIVIDGVRDIFTPTKIFDLCERVISQYSHEEDYLSAIKTMAYIIDVVSKIPGYDRMIVDYAKDVHAKYAVLCEQYQKTIDEEIDKKIDLIFPENYKRAYYASKKNIETYEKFRKFATKSDALKKKAIWLDIMVKNKNDLASRIYFGKR
ncbi:MAG: hypothetical protein AABZ39_10725 [Spirochaetota bacterium]